METNDVKVHFYVANDQIHINHTGSSAADISLEMGRSADYPLILFSYDFSNGSLCAENLTHEGLLAVLKSLKRKKMKKSVQGDLSDAVKQIQTAAKFLRKTYGWAGEIESKEDKGFHQDIHLSLSDFKVVHDYLKVFFKNYNAEIFDIDICIVDSLDDPSVFLEEDEEYGEVSGPAIVLKRTNSFYNMAEAIIYQYVLNYDKIVEFDVGLRQEYIEDAKYHVDDAMRGFFRNEVIDNKSFWYLEKIGSRVYLKKNDNMLSSRNLESRNGSGSVLTFEYVISDDSRYVIVNGVDRHAVRSLSMYRKMFDFLMKNVDKIGHIGEDGKPLKEDPIVLFRPFKREITPLFLSNLPVWIFIENLLSVIYDFTPEDILILRGDFNNPNAFTLVTNLDALNNQTDYPLAIEDSDLPLLLWNMRTEESAASEVMSLMVAYAKFIGVDNFGVSANSDMSTLLQYIRDKVLSNGEKIYAIEHLFMILIQDTEHVHEYNLFKIIFEIMGFYNAAIEAYIDQVTYSNQLEQVVKRVDEIQEKLYYLILKATLITSKIRYGAGVSRKVSPIKGDLVMDIGMERVMRVEAVCLEPPLAGEQNPMGAMITCRDMLSGEEVQCVPEDIFVIALNFGDDEAYNYKKASKKAEAGEEELSHYKSLLSPFLRNKKRPNPLCDGEDEKEEPPTFDAYLQEQRGYFEREGGDMIVEYLLDKCRKVRDYEGEPKPTE